MVGIVVLGTLLGVVVVLWTSEACARDAAEGERDEARERVTVLERAARMRARSLRALADLVAGR